MTPNPPTLPQAISSWTARNATSITPAGAAQVVIFFLHFGPGGAAPAADPTPALCARIATALPPPADAARLLRTLSASPLPLPPGTPQRALALALMRLLAASDLPAPALLDAVSSCVHRPPCAAAPLLADPAAAALVAAAAVRATAPHGQLRLLRALASAGTRPGPALVQALLAAVLPRAPELDGAALSGLWESLGELGVRLSVVEVRALWAETGLRVREVAGWREDGAAGGKRVGGREGRGKAVERLELGVSALWALAALHRATLAEGGGGGGRKRRHRGRDSQSDSDEGEEGEAGEGVLLLDVQGAGEFMQSCVATCVQAYADLLVGGGRGGEEETGLPVDWVLLPLLHQFFRCAAHPPPCDC